LRDIRHCPINSFRLSYPKIAHLPISNWRHLGFNDVDSTQVYIVAEKLLDRMRRIISAKHYSLRTEKAIYKHVVQRDELGARSPLDGMT